MTLSPELKAILRWLRRTHPLPLPTRVTIVSKLPREWDDANGIFEPLPFPYPTRFRIRLAPQPSPIEARETLLHEWAHGLAFVAQLAAKSHGEHDSVFMETFNQLVEEFRLAFPHLLLRRDRL